jgi:hypothetical protein
VQNHNNTAKAGIELSTEPTEPTELTHTSRLPWHAEVGRLLTQAAGLCVDHGVDLDAFMKGAWSAYVESRPGMRDYLEEMQLRDQLEDMRKNGRMGEA